MLDADALTAFSDDPAELFCDLHEGCILTPHMGEFARLFPDLAAPLKEAPRRGPAPSRLDAARVGHRLELGHLAGVGDDALAQRETIGEIGDLRRRCHHHSLRPPE